jgi:DNA mismatch endonuclease (patch repair protein)
MADVVSREVRSRMMSGIGGKNTEPELALRKALHARGLRFRLHDRRLPGKPDMVLPRWRTVVFVNGCFWHRHDGCRFATTPGTRPEFWAKKFAANVLRDRRNAELLAGAGWHVVVAWECEIRQDIEAVAETVERVVRSGR